MQVPFSFFFEENPGSLLHGRRGGCAGRGKEGEEITGAHLQGKVVPICRLLAGVYEGQGGGLAQSAQKRLPPVAEGQDARIGDRAAEISRSDAR